MGNQVDRNMDHPSEEQQQQQQQRMQQHIQQHIQQRRQHIQHIQQHVQQHIQQHRQHIQHIQQQRQRQRRPADQRRPRSNGQQRSSSARAATNANGRNRRATNTAPRPRVARTSGASSASSSATEGRGTSGMSNHNNNSDASTRHVGGGSRHSRTSTLRSSTAPPPIPLPEVEDVEVDVVGDALPHPPSSLGPSSSSSLRGVKRPLFDGEHVSAPPHSRHRIATTEEPQREIAGPSSAAASVSRDASRGIASLAERPSTSTSAFTTSSSGLSGPSSSSSSSSATTSRRPFPSLFSDAPYNVPHSISDSDDSGEDNDDERQQLRTTALVGSNDPRREDADGILGADTTVEVADVVASLPGTSNAESPVGADEVQVVGFQTAVIDVEEEDENRPQIIRSTNSQPIVISDDEDDEVEFIASSSTDHSRDRSQNDSSVMFIRESPRRPESNADDLPTTSGSAPLPAAPIPSSPISANPPTSVSSPSRSFPLGSGNVAEAGDLPPGGLTRPDHYDSPASGPSNLRPYDYPPLPRQRQSDSTSGYGGCVLPPPPPPPQPFSPRPTQPIASTSTSSSSGRDYGFVNLVGASTSYGHSSHSSSQSRPAASTSTFDGISGNTATTRATTSARPSSSFFPWDPPPFHDPTTHDPVDVFSSATRRFQCRCNPPSTRHTDDRDCMTDQIFGGRSAHSAGGMQMSRPAFTSAGTSQSASRAVTAASSGTTPTLPPSQAVSDAPRLPPPVAAAATPVAAPVAGPSVAGPSTASAPTSQDGISCPVCMDSLSEIKSEGKQVVSTNCGHVFCSQCIKDAVRTQKRCPTCRKKLSARQYHVLYL